MSSSESLLGSIWAQERRDDEQNRRLTVYVSTGSRPTRSRLVLCGACKSLVSDRLNFTDEEKPDAGDECAVCGEDGKKRWKEK